MKKIYFVILTCFIAVSSFSQFYAGVAGNNTPYKGNFQKSTAGAHLRAGYSSAEKISADLGFTYHSLSNKAVLFTLQMKQEMMALMYHLKSVTSSKL